MVGDWGFEKAVAEWAVTCVLANEPESDDVENAASFSKKKSWGS